MSCHYSDNIRFDLLRTGSVEQTTNKILERGFLDAVRILFSFVPLQPYQYWSSQPPAAYHNALSSESRTNARSYSSTRGSDNSDTEKED